MKSKINAVNTHNRTLIYRLTVAAAVVLIIAGGAFGIMKAAKGEGTLKTDNKWANLPEGYEFMADTTVPEDAVLPPSQMGRSVAEAEYDCCYDILSAFEDSEAVCLATVKNYLGETEAGTYFEVKTERLYKGELPDTFVLYQCSNSEFVLQGSPLYTYGDKLLLFLDTWGYEGYEGSYETIGADLTLLYAAAAEDGNIYLLDHRGIFSYNTEQGHPGISLSNYASNTELTEELLNYLDSFDKVITEQVRRYSDASVNDSERVPLKLHIYALEEIEDLFSQLGN